MTVDDRRDGGPGRPAMGCGSGGERGEPPSVGTLAAATLRRAVARLDLGSWEVVTPWLRARLVPVGRAGPIHRPVPQHRTGPRPAAPVVVFDVGVEIDWGIVRPDPTLIAAWGQEPDTIWRVARSNLDRRPDLAAVTVRSLRPRLQLLSGGPWTTGHLLLPRRLPVDRSSPVLAVAPSPHLLVVADRPATGAGSSRSEGSLLGPLLEIGRRLAVAAPEPLPLQPVRLPG